MKHRCARFIFFALLVCSPLAAHVTGRIGGQLGNNLFQVATSSALAWDNATEAYFPEMETHTMVYKRVFFRINTCKAPEAIAYDWKERSLAYFPIPYVPNIQLEGYFQCEKYFAHHRQRVLELFAPHPEDLAYIHQKYQWLLDHPQTVGVQLRYYKFEFPDIVLYPQYGRDYFEKAMAHFPESTLFVVSSNNLEYARKNIPEGIKNVVFLENEPHYIDLHLLSLCKHNIITNSSFGWWAAWLNQNPDKVIIRPKEWILGPYHTEDICPKDWITIKASYE